MFDNLLLPFLINNSQIRGRIGKFSNTIDNIFTKHNYPLPIAELLGEMLLLAALISDMFKSKRLLTLQIKSDGIVKLLIADCFDNDKLRGYARWDDENLSDYLGGTIPSFSELLNNGQLVVTLDNGIGSDPYQGIVELIGNNLSECLEKYFLQSEQIATIIKLAVTFDVAQEKWFAGGIMLQQMPNLTYQDDWHKNTLFLHTLVDNELTNPTITIEKLLYSLFHEDGVWVDTGKIISDGCRCSRARFESILNSISSQDLPEFIVDGKVIFTCEFCNSKEDFIIDHIMH